MRLLSVILFLIFNGFCAIAHTPPANDGDDKKNKPCNCSWDKFTNMEEEEGSAYGKHIEGETHEVSLGNHDVSRLFSLIGPYYELDVDIDDVVSIKITSEKSSFNIKTVKLVLDDDEEIDLHQIKGVYVDGEGKFSNISVPQNVNRIVITAWTRAFLWDTGIMKVDVLTSKNHGHHPY